jgi:hypothetical protein
MTPHTDGSEIEGESGAAVVDLRGHHSRSQMWTKTRPRCKPELRGLELALNTSLGSMGRWARQARSVLVIFAESQATLKALGQPRMPSGRVNLEGCPDLIKPVP